MRTFKSSTASEPFDGRYKVLTWLLVVFATLCVLCGVAGFVISIIAVQKTQYVPPRWVRNLVPVASLALPVVDRAGPGTWVLGHLPEMQDVASGETYSPKVVKYDDRPAPYDTGIPLTPEDGPGIYSIQGNIGYRFVSTGVGIVAVEAASTIVRKGEMIYHEDGSTDWITTNADGSTTTYLRDTTIPLNISWTGYLYEGDEVVITAAIRAINGTGNPKTVSGTDKTFPGLTLSPTDTYINFTKIA